MKLFLAVALIVLLLLAGACSSGPQRKDPIPLTDEEKAFLARLEDPETYSLKQDVPVLFQGLTLLITDWEKAYREKRSPKHIRVYKNLSEVITRTVYVNFESILDQLHHGSQPNRSIAAAALGFSRIPEDPGNPNPNLPPQHHRAVEALIDVLGCGDDNIVMNALLGLSTLGDPDTEIETIMDIMIHHHNPEVRSNAALALQACVTREDADIALPYVLAALKDEEPKVRDHCILAILKLKDDSAIHALLELLDDPYPLNQAGAARAIGVMEDVTLCSYLIPKLNSKYPIVREYALKSLRDLSGEDFEFDVEEWSEWWDSQEE